MRYFHDFSICERRALTLVKFLRLGTAAIARSNCDLRRLPLPAAGSLPTDAKRREEGRNEKGGTREEERGRRKEEGDW